MLKATLVAIFKGENFNVKQHYEYQHHDEYGRNIRPKGLSKEELMMKKKRISDLEKAFNPLHVFEVFPKLMNHMVVAFMKEDTDGKVALHASEKALLGKI